jgi:ribosomal protein S18 acetylase RimI-like enzyme
MGDVETDTAALLIRPARLPDDMPGLVRLFFDVHDATPEHGHPVTEDYARAIHQPVAPDHLLLVAELDGEVVGTLDARLRRDDAAGFVGVYVDNLAVAAAHRSRGIGTRLMTAVEDWASAQSARSVALDTELSNAGAQRLYQRLGYQRRAVIMAKDLR